MADYKYTESHFENAVLELFEKQDYEYECGYDIHRQTTDILLIADFKEYLLKRYFDLNLEDDEIDAVVHNLLYARGQAPTFPAPR